VITEKVMDILWSHAGLFRSVCLTSEPVSSLRALLQIMAAKGMEELVILNCEWLTPMMVLQPSSSAVNP